MIWLRMATDDRLFERDNETYNYVKGGKFEYGCLLRCSAV